jgi:hypothetical protein
MQERRRGESPPAKTPSGDVFKVPAEYWEDLEQCDIETICANAGAKSYPHVGLLLPFLKEYLLVDMQNRSVCRQGHGQWERIDNSLLELVCLVYLLNAGPEPISQEMISAQELKSAHFFMGPHELKVKPLLKLYGNDLDGFKKAAGDLGGESLDLADAAYKFLVFPKVPLYYLFWAGDDEFDPRLSILFDRYKFLVFPKVPLYYLFWAGDDEFAPRLSILFDRSIEHHLAADAIWGLVNLVSEILTGVT